MSQVELTNMCMIVNPDTNQVLVQERVKSWKGFSFPGGHIEAGESIMDSTIREIHEETGFTVANLELCGIVNWVHDVTGDRYFVFCYRTDEFQGEMLEQTDEGRLFWVDKEQLASLPLAEGFADRLPMFFDKQFSEGFGVWNEDAASGLRWQ